MPHIPFVVFFQQAHLKGLHVTTDSTVQLLEFVHSAALEYLMTSHLRKDKLENIFGIVQQSSSTNAIPTSLHSIWY